MNEKGECKIGEAINVKEGMLHLPPSFAIRVEHKVLYKKVATFLVDSLKFMKYGKYRDKNI